MCFLFFFVGIYLFRKPHASGLHHPIFCVGFEGADFARVKKTSHSTVQLCFFLRGLLLGNGPAVTFSTPISEGQKKFGVLDVFL